MTSAPVSSAPASSLTDVSAALRHRGFVVHLADNRQTVMPIILERILPGLKARTFAFGGSLTLSQTAPDLGDELRRRGLLWPTEETGLPWPEVRRQRRSALMSDLYFTGTNAITAQGQLVNLDAVGNRVAALTFGPDHVVVVAGRNKIVSDLPSAFQRLRKIAPKNAARLGLKTPCAASGNCIDCSSPHRICNLWGIIERPEPAGRIEVILVDDDLGL